jgi:hypothetical protein
MQAVRDADGNIVRLEGTVEDITDRKVAEERVQFLAFYDALTGLAQWDSSPGSTSHGLAGAHRRKDKIALLFLDFG